MDRRRYLAATAAALIAGCNGLGGDPNAQTDTPTPSPTATDTETDQPADTATPTATETETPTPDAEERARSALEEARRRVGRAHAAYLDQADDASTLAEVSAATTGFDATPVAEEIEQAHTSLDAASEDASEEQDDQIEALRTSATWLLAVAEFQAATSTVVEHLERVADLVEDVDDAASFEDYDEVVENLESAEATLPDVRATRVAVDDYDREAFQAVDGVDPDAVEAVDDRLVRLSLAFDALGDYVARARRQTRRVENAREDIESQNTDDAEREARQAADELRGAGRSVADRNNPESFAPVAELFQRMIDALVALAEETVADAEDA